MRQDPLMIAIIIQAWYDSRGIDGVIGFLVTRYPPFKAVEDLSDRGVHLSPSRVLHEA